MRITLAYGKTGLPVSFPDDWDVTVVAPRHVAGVPDARAAVRQALLAPIQAPALCDFVRPGDRVGIIFSDISRPTPHHLILPPILEQLAHVPAEDIVLFNACGTHRKNTDDELRTMLGDALVDGYPIIQNDALDESTLACFGRTSRGHEIWLNRELMACDVKILTGFIEPHFFAGFSGGGKAIMPGMGGLPTILGNHDAASIGDPRATWGVTHGNPIWEEIQAVAAGVSRTFLVNVALNREKHITGVFAGDLDAAHAAGCAFVRQTVMAPVPHAYDIVVTSNSGYPLDLNLYQTVKGMSAAAQIVRPGGAIIAAAECWDGIPDHGLYGSLLREAKDPRDLLERIAHPDFLQQDQWQAQIQALIQQKATVFVHSHHLTADQIRAALLEPCASIEETAAALRQEMGPGCRICVLPEGPQTIPYIAQA